MFKLSDILAITWYCQYVIIKMYTVKGDGEILAQGENWNFQSCKYKHLFNYRVVSIGLQDNAMIISVK